MPLRSILVLLACGAALLATVPQAECQANAPITSPGAIVPRAYASLPPHAPSNWTDLQKRTSKSAPNAGNGAFLGCYDITKFSGLAWDTATPTPMKPVTKCRDYCDNRWFPFTIVKAWGGCICTQELPQASARLDNSVCDKLSNPNAIALFYNHIYANVKACRVIDVPLQPSSFRWAYNQDKTSFANGRMTLRMDGANGQRLYYPTAMEYGFVEVWAKVSITSGVVTAFYLRSDIHQETYDFSEIDFEFLNGHPGVPGGVWTNSFYKGMSYGEQLLQPSWYQRHVGSNCNVGQCWYKFAIHWQPSWVLWVMNNRVVRRNYYDQKVKWCDMNNKCYEKGYRPPALPSYPTFSMWTDHSNNGAFGGQLPSNGPFFSEFERMRTVVCDRPVSSYNGPSWASPPASSVGISLE